MKKEALGWRIARDILIALGFFMVLAPMYLVVVNTFKSLDEAGKNFFSLPQSLDFSNYMELFTKNNYWAYVRNSAVISIVGIILVIIVNPAVSYAISRNFRRPYYKTVYYLIIMGLFVPFQVIMLPLTKIMTDMNLLSPGGLIILYTALSLSKGVFMFVNYIRSLPLEIEEAAQIDGCSPFQTFWKVTFPLLGPCTGSMIILNGLGIWNDYLMPYLALPSGKAKTITVEIASFVGQYTARWDIVFAGTIISIIPALAIFCMFQKYFVKGITAGAAKG